MQQIGILDLKVRQDLCSFTYREVMISNKQAVLVNVLSIFQYTVNIKLDMAHHRIFREVSSNYRAAFKSELL